MADLDNVKESKNYYLDIPQKNSAFFVKGSGSLDWGMQNRLARIFSPESGRTVMLAIDHGYFQGPTSGLERVDVNIVPLAPYADALMLTRGILRSVVPVLLRQRRGAARQRRPQHPQGTLQRATGPGHRGRPAAQRRGHGGAGVHRRRVRDPVHPQPHAAGGHGQPVRHARAGSHRCGQEHDSRRPLLPAGLPHRR